MHNYQVYPTSGYPTFSDVFGEFLAEPAVREAAPHAAALAIAGAVNNNKCEMTNVKWLVDGDELQSKFGLK